MIEIGRDSKHVPILIDPDEKWSFKDFTGRQFLGEDVSGAVIYRSCFSQESYHAIFNAKTSGVTFAYCNLDNVLLPDNSMLIACSNRRIELQNDLRDWEVDDNRQPVKVTGEKGWKALRVSVDPADIPADMMTADEAEVLHNGPKAASKKAAQEALVSGLYDIAKNADDEFILTLKVKS